MDLAGIGRRLARRARDFVRDRQVLSHRTARGLAFDLLRLQARLLHHWTQTVPAADRLHLGCGSRRVAGWLNVDVAGSEFDVDLGCGNLPWPRGSFQAVVAQQVVEHLEIDTQLLPLLRELRRVIRPGGEIWCSSPDMAVLCESYLHDRGRWLESDRKMRWPDFSLCRKPPQHMLNEVFHQEGEHVNLFDYELLEWLFEQAGFIDCERTDEPAFLRRFPGFPPRNDDKSSVYLRAKSPPLVAH